ncbi:GNAT family N-acetyltransferase [Streptomyces sp. A73]|uniref:GNAT family N-acetyltransferase n=1 Tax=Streptomyces sp. B15 TaxID=1537797 RepID=UPI00161DA8D3|nr:GNAT family N-acetyltransferase [Streptomyces sp. B15]MBQ1125260.1 GNAT family N-acetyltransferase [Streptomyces sp. B15]MBQ1161640.1 GNAT family N-acetyltransferase [Streptomyces sp. A73]
MRTGTAAPKPRPGAASRAETAAYGSEAVRGLGTVRVRHILHSDWDSVAALERDAYAGLGLSEGPAALQSRASASPGTCFLLDVGSRTAGYLLALPYPAFRYPDLEQAQGATAFRTRNLHLHDIVVTRTLRRRGLAQQLLRHLTRTAQARGHERISLVAVGGSERFWAARGFVPHPGVVPPGSGYGTGAVYMSRPVPVPVPQHEVS